MPCVLSWMLLAAFGEGLVPVAGEVNVGEGIEGSGRCRLEYDALGACLVHILADVFDCLLVYEFRIDSELGALVECYGHVRPGVDSSMLVLGWHRLCPGGGLLQRV
jgi:hypothetical protein